MPEKAAKDFFIHREISLAWFKALSQCGGACVHTGMVLRYWLFLNKSDRISATSKKFEKLWEMQGSKASWARCSLAPNIMRIMGIRALLPVPWHYEHYGNFDPPLNAPVAQSCHESSDLAGLTANRYACNSSQKWVMIGVYTEISRPKSIGYLFARVSYKLSRCGSK